MLPEHLPWDPFVEKAENVILGLQRPQHTECIYVFKVKVAGEESRKSGEGSEGEGKFLVSLFAQKRQNSSFLSPLFFASYLAQESSGLHSQAVSPPGL